MSPDSDASRKRVSYESKSAALAGRRMLEVRYWDVHNFTEEPRVWDFGDWHHAVMGVELLTDRSPSCVLWTRTFFCYGVEVFHTPMTEQLVMDEDGPGCWTAGDSDETRDRGGLRRRGRDHGRIHIRSDAPDRVPRLRVPRQ